MLKDLIVVDASKFLQMTELETARQSLRWSQEILRLSRNANNHTYFTVSAENGVKAALSWVWDAQEREKN